MKIATSAAKIKDNTPSVIIQYQKILTLAFGLTS